jgi:hypothetical protein
MKNMRKKNIIRDVSVFLIAAVIIVTSFVVVADSQQKLSFISIKKTMTLSDLSRDEYELKYYAEENLDQLIGLSGDSPPYIWQTAIRLTQDEMVPYMGWTLTKVNVAFSGDNGQPEIDVTIIIYDKGTTSTEPGPIIVQDTTAHLDTTGITTIPLVTPVDLAGHEELWVAVQWVQTEPGPGVYYAWIDTLSGPHVPDKSDFIYYNNAWSQLHDLLPSADGRWGIGAIVEGIPLQPPNKPVISGPTNGTVGILYSYTVNSTDPDGDDIYYLIDWGDGNYENWIGPYNTGETVTLHYSWSEKGTYLIQAKARDDYTGESTWSDPFFMTIKGPILLLGNITGSFGVSIDIKNIGDADATNVISTIKITGGLLKRTIVNISQTISTITPNTTVTPIVRPIGFGWITITVTVRSEYTPELQKKAEGLLLFFITTLPPQRVNNN